ncbi:MAG: hypothetical protein AUI14_12540 [Actinobacteria bacterium 13_2_20CM_2_71_6]|nr:MAG: hypothetical protein AUI14_12540 [Actinobacteria bacterium 13_2_20CM_2_71_6]
MAEPLHETQYMDSHRGIDARRLWLGGVATAVVAMLATAVGFLVARGLFGVAVLAPARDGAWAMSVPPPTRCARAWPPCWRPLSSTY